MAVHTTRQNFSRALTAAKEDLDKLQKVAASLAEFDQGFTSRVLDLVTRWNAFSAQASQAARTLTGWEKHAGKLDLFEREIGVFKNAAAKKIQEMEAEKGKQPPGRRRPRTGPPARRQPQAVTPEVPRAIKQNIGPIAAAVGVGALVLFAILKRKR